MANFFFGGWGGEERRIVSFQFEHIKKKLNLLADENNLAVSTLKTFVYGKLNTTEYITFVFHRVENIVGKGENAAYQAYFINVNSRHCVVEVNPEAARQFGVF